MTVGKIDKREISEKKTPNRQIHHQRHIFLVIFMMMMTEECFYGHADLELMTSFSF
jgi:hypothetical protein